MIAIEHACTSLNHCVSPLATIQETVTPNISPVATSNSVRKHRTAPTEIAPGNFHPSSLLLLLLLLLFLLLHFLFLFFFLHFYFLRYLFFHIFSFLISLYLLLFYYSSVYFSSFIISVPPSLVYLLFPPLCFLSSLYFPLPFHFIPFLILLSLFLLLTSIILSLFLFLFVLYIVLSFFPSFSAAVAAILFSPPFVFQLLRFPSLYFSSSVYSAPFSSVSTRPFLPSPIVVLSLQRSQAFIRLGVTGLFKSRLSDVNRILLVCIPFRL